ncbi:MAG TPA: hypothetical protein VH684_10535 [Xanthobacteraceae bacterium]|jgi:hypothetical protein
MRARLAAISADRLLHAVILTAGLLFGALVLLVGLPLAGSTPYPSAHEDDPVAAAQSSIARKSGREQPSRSAAEKPRSIGWQALTAPMGVLADPGAIVAMRIPDPIWEDDLPAAKDTEPSPEEDAPVTLASIPPPPAQATSRPETTDEVIQYLWDVYQRVPIKRDSGGDFTWKDQAAAKRMGLSLTAYVIGGMDPDFREQLYHAGKAMDAAGIHWSMLSAFRDDWRQQVASGFKAHTGNSLHGGSRATGGYGHGRAVDVTSVDEKDEEVWHWVDAHGAKFGLRRPMPGVDPAHIQAGGDWHRIAVALREGRATEGFSLASAREKPVRKLARERVAEDRGEGSRAMHHRHAHRHS